MNSLNHPDIWKQHLPVVVAESNKYTRGHAVIFGGYPITGAARLAARACARTGTGLTTIAVTPRALEIYAKHLESIMVRLISSTGNAVKLVNEKTVTGVLIGPGYGLGRKTRGKVTAILETKKPTVLDADALSAFARNPSKLFTQISGPCVITPHEGEFERLFSITGSRIDRARASAKLSNSVVVLKGSETVIASPGGEVIINPPATAYLATAGSGDVLAGIIVSLLAQGMSPFLASAAGVWIHSQIGALLGKSMIAEDMPNTIITVLNKLALK